VNFGINFLMTISIGLMGSSATHFPRPDRDRSATCFSLLVGFFLLDSSFANDGEGM
jgi:hypothetical protein